MKILHPKQRAFRRAQQAAARRSIPGLQRKPRNIGCYGVCCGRGTRRTMLCTVCRRTAAQRMICCGYHMISVEPWIEVPPAHADNRWKEFLRRFPRYGCHDFLKVIPDEALADARKRIVQELALVRAH